MSEFVPFLRPDMPPFEAYRDHLEEMHSTGLFSNFGPLNRRFEEAALEKLFGGVGSVSTVASATAGLMLAIALEMRPGRFVITPSFTFAATAQAIRWVGFEPYFVDVDPETWTVTPAAVEEALDTLGDACAGVVPYATFGTLMDTEWLAALHSRGIPVVIDAAASIGSVEAGRQFGSGFPGSVVFSMHATKPFAIGEGGLVYSGSANLIDDVRRGSNFGFDNRESVTLGLNAKLSEPLAAIALATLDRFDEVSARRQWVYDVYLAAFRRHGLDEWQFQQLHGSPTHQFLSVLAPPGQIGEAVASRLLTDGIQARTYFSPSCHQQKLFADHPRAALPVTEDLARRIVSLPLWSAMDEVVVDRIVGALAA